MIVEKDKIKTITGKAFRLVVLDEKVIAEIEGTEKSITTTVHGVEEFVTKEAMSNEIKISRYTPWVVAI